MITVINSNSTKYIKILWKLFQVSRQLQDPIIIMTSNLPSWLKDVASVCPFLFPFETRQVHSFIPQLTKSMAATPIND